MQNTHLAKTGSDCSDSTVYTHTHVHPPTHTQTPATHRGNLFSAAFCEKKMGVGDSVCTDQHMYFL